MIVGLANVFVALSCKYVIDPVMFGALADELDELMITHVGWHPGVPAIHLDIAHGRQLIEHFFPIPIGFLSEEPLESHNQLAKLNRQFHTFKSSRLNQMEQWFHASLDGSDPLVLDQNFMDPMN